MNIPVFKPLIESEELKAAQDALELGWLGMGSYVGRFEDAIKSYVEADDRYVAAVSTGHAALHIGLLLAGVGPGDEVITPAFNNIADFQAVLAVGATPVFCDIEDDTLCIDLAQAEQLLGPHTKAMIVMDYACALVDHDRVADFAQIHGIRIIHDAAHSFGSLHNGRKIGSFSDICMFSFDPVKTITCIDGGALVVRSEAELKMIQELRLIGMGQPSTVMYQDQRAWTYDVRRLGFRYHMANMHAAIGLAQIQKMARISKTRREICLHYSSRLAAAPFLRCPQTTFSDITPFLYYIRVPETERDGLRNHLSDRGIDTGIHWQPGHWFTLFKNCRRGSLQVTERVGRQILSLPLSSDMTKDTAEIVARAVISYFERP